MVEKLESALLLPRAELKQMRHKIPGNLLTTASHSALFLGQKRVILAEANQLKYLDNIVMNEIPLASVLRVTSRFRVVARSPVLPRIASGCLVHPHPL
jgi:hypothetical protein